MNVWGRVKAIPMLAIGVCLAGSTQPLMAWSMGGHRVVASIAWMQLDANTRATAVGLIKQHPRFEEDFRDRMPQSVAGQSQAVKDQWFFLQAAAWPDIARETPAKRPRCIVGTGTSSTTPLQLGLLWRTARFTIDTTADQLLSEDLQPGITVAQPLVLESQYERKRQAKHVYRLGARGGLLCGCEKDFPPRNERPF